MFDMKKIIALALAAAIFVPNAVLAKEAEPASAPETLFENERKEEPLYEKGNFSNSFTEVEHRNNSRAWREGMVGGNGETGFVTSGSPYTDTIIYQHMYFNYPSSQPRVIPDYLTEQLEEARENVFNLNDAWKIWDYDSNGNKVTRSRTYFYSYHPGAQLRITSENADKYSNYKRWTNYETAEVGVKYTDKYGEWKRTTFTSREDNVTITKIEKSSEGQLINDIISIDNISEMYKAKNGNSRVLDQRYKKLVGPNADYLALVSHYPVYTGSPLYDGGFGNVIKIIAEGENAEKEVGNQIKKLKGVGSVTYSSKDEELNKLIDKQGKDGKELFESYREDNPLGSAYEVEAKDPTKLASLAKKIQDIPNVNSVNYGGDSTQSMVTTLNTIQKAGSVFIVGLVIVALFMISNTIKITITARSTEISIMRMVGASNWYIRIPFMLEGMLIGLFGAIIPILVLVYGYGALYNYTGGSLMSSMLVLKAPMPFIRDFSFILAGLGAGVGLIGSFVSMRRFLKF